MIQVSKLSEPIFYQGNQIGITFYPMNEKPVEYFFKQ